MKKIILLLAVLRCGLARAQTNARGPAAKPAARAMTEISSAAADFDLNSHQAVYRGHVVVNDPEMKLRCDQLVVFIPQNGERLNHIEAQTNVVIDFADNHGQMTHATGALAVYRYEVQAGVTNETVTLSGQPQVESAQGILTGDQITWNRSGNRLSATNPHMIPKQNFEGGTGTNASPLKLF